MKKINKVFGLFGLVLIVSAGCSDDPPPPPLGDETGCEPEATGGPIELEGCETLENYMDESDVCGPCRAACQTMYECLKEGVSTPCPICADTPEGAENICEEFLGEGAYAQEVPCYLPDSGCVGWNPAAEVTVNEVTGAKQLDQSFIDSVIADPSLLYCDGAYFEPYTGTGGGWVLTGAASGGLLYELGFRNGDRLAEINNYPLVDFADLAVAFAALSVSDPSLYTIEVVRTGTGPTVINVDAL